MVMYTMYKQFIRDRITELRIQKGVSEYKMSLDMGHSKNYIRNITSGTALPAMGEFLYICEYFGITPKQFFDIESDYKDSVRLNKLWSVVQKLNDNDIDFLIEMAQKMKNT